MIYIVFVFKCLKKLQAERKVERKEEISKNLKMLYDYVMLGQKFLNMNDLDKIAL